MRFAPNISDITNCSWAAPDMAARELSTATISALRRVAARCSAVPHEAEDIVQDILLAAVQSGRDCGDPRFLPWACGAIRNHAKFVARGAARRKRRERLHALGHDCAQQSLPHFSDTFIATLPRSRRAVALLINLGMGRREIGYLLGLTDMALRQRISGLRRAFEAHGRAAADPDEHPQRFSADGVARRTLKNALPSHGGRRFAIRDPDGLPIFFASADHNRTGGGNRLGEQQ